MTALAVVSGRPRPGGVMSQLFHRPATGDTVPVPDVLVAKYEADPAWKPGPMPETPADPPASKPASLSKQRTENEGDR